MSKMKSKGPLLYVHQPFSRIPTNNNMQEIYTSRREQEQEPQEEEIQKKTQKKISLAKRELFQEQIPIEVINAENTQTTHHPQKHQTGLKRVKPFKEMDVMSRLDYLINFPKVLPPVPCVFYTNEKNYQGYLTEYDQNHVTIQFHDQTSKTIPLEEIKDVIMIGIKNV